MRHKRFTCMSPSNLFSCSGFLSPSVISFHTLKQTFIVSLFNWHWRFMLSAPCEWRLMLLDGFRAEQSQPGLGGHPWVLALCIFLQNIPFKPKLLSGSLPAWLTLIKAMQWGRGEGLIVPIFPVFLHPRTLLWSICNCLWKNRRQVLLPSVFGVVLTVQCGRGMLAINSQLSPSEGQIEITFSPTVLYWLWKNNVSLLLISSGVAFKAYSEYKKALLKNFRAWPRAQTYPLKQIIFRVHLFAQP